MSHPFNDEDINNYHINGVYGFTKVPHWLALDPRISPVGKCLIMYIASFQKCRSSQETMAKALGISKKVAGEQLRLLRELNIITYETYPFYKRTYGKLSGKRTRQTEYIVCHPKEWGIVITK